MQQLALIIAKFNSMQQQENNVKICIYNVREYIQPTSHLQKWSSKIKMAQIHTSKFIHLSKIILQEEMWSSLKIERSQVKGWYKWIQLTSIFTNETGINDFPD